MQSQDQKPRFTFFSHPSQEVVSTSTWEDLPVASLNREDLLEKGKRPSGETWWLDIRDATQEDVDAVVQAMSIHPLTAEDIALRESREKIEVFRNYYLIAFQTLVPGTVRKEGDDPKTESQLRTSIPGSAEFYILVFHGCTVTFSPSGCDHVSRVWHRIRRLHDPSKLSSDWICYALIDDIIDSFEPHMRSAERESESIEDEVFIARAEDITFLIPRVDRLRKKITHLSHCLSGKSDVLNGFINRCRASHSPNTPLFPAGDPDLVVYLGDVQDHLVTTMANLNHFDEIVGRSQSNFLAQLSVNNLRLSVTLNSGLSKVTVLATIFVPLHLVTGLFGMNVEVPGQEVDNLGWFFGIVGLFCAFTLVCCVAAARYKLL